MEKINNVECVELLKRLKTKRVKAKRMADERKREEEEKRSKFYRTRLGGFVNSSKYHLLVVQARKGELAGAGRNGRKERLRGLEDEEISNTSQLLMLRAKLVGARLKWQKDKFDGEQDEDGRREHRYSRLKVVKRGDLGRRCKAVSLDVLVADLDAGGEHLRRASNVGRGVELLEPGSGAVDDGAGGDGLA